MNCFPLFGLDLILGIDWLLVNHAMINYSEKSIMLLPIPVRPVKPICLFLNSVRIKSGESDNQGYVLLMASEVELEQVLDEIPVVRKYPDVFPDDISEFPRKKKSSFHRVGTENGPISIASYRTSLMELLKLKGQLEVLLEKKFVRPNASPSGVPVLLVKERREHEIMYGL